MLEIETHKSYNKPIRRHVCNRGLTHHGYRHISITQPLQAAAFIPLHPQKRYKSLKHNRQNVKFHEQKPPFPPLFTPHFPLIPPTKTTPTKSTHYHFDTTRRTTPSHNVTQKPSKPPFRHHASHSNPPYCHKSHFVLQTY